MTETIEKLESMLSLGSDYFAGASDSELSHRSAPGKWSKKEVLGHLVDSAINNLQRFTEIQFADLPYRVRKYRQDELVRANNYQEADPEEILGLWLGLNRRIAVIMSRQDEKTLSYPLILPDGSTADLRFLMTDYADHMEHHLKQLLL